MTVKDEQIDMANDL